MVRGEGRGEGDYIRIWTTSIFNMADFTYFWNTKIEGLFFTSAASFQILGKVKIGNLFTSHPPEKKELIVENDVGCPLLVALHI